eukprot:gene2100-2799_t
MGGADRDYTSREAEVISNFEALAKHIEDLGFGKQLRDDDGESSSGDDNGDEEVSGEEDEDAEDLTNDSAGDSDGEDDVVSRVFRMCIMKNIELERLVKLCRGLSDLARGSKPPVYPLPEPSRVSMVLKSGVERQGKNTLLSD